MDVMSSLHSCCQKLCHAYSLKRSCLFLLLFLLVPLVFLGLATSIIIFVMKPQKPVFSLQNVSVDSYKLNAYSNSTLFVSLVITLTLNAQNHNRVGIWYTPSHLEALYDGVPIGTIRIPGFLQPAHSSNVTMQTRLLFPSVNASQIAAEASSLQHEPGKDMFQMKIVGDLGAHLLLFHILLLKIKVGLECDINIDFKELTNQNVVHNAGTIGFVPASFPTNFLNCTLEIYTRGGRKFGFVNLARLGCLPGLRIIKPENNGSCLEEVSSLARLHNHALAKVLRKLAHQLKGFKYSLYDLNHNLRERTRHPSKYGFKEGRSACCGIGQFRGEFSCGGKRIVKEFELCEDPNEYVFWDSFHLTEKVNSQLAYQMWCGEGEDSKTSLGLYKLKDLFTDL